MNFRKDSSVEFFYMARLFSLTCLLSSVQFTITNAQTFSEGNLFQSSVFTPPHTFTRNAEGPAVDRFGTIYAVNFHHKGTIGQITPSGESSLFIELPDSSVGNGIRFNSDGDMLIADYTNHNILKVDMATKKITVFAHESKMTQPNDIAIDKKDRVYASDPNFKAKTGRVWRIDNNGSVTLLDSMEGATNGIEVSPDEKRLYVNSSGKVWSYNLSKTGNISKKTLLIEFPDFGMDGMRCDVKGNLYIARIGKGTVVKVSPAGKILQEIKLTGKNPTNVAFGGEDGRTVYVTLMDQGNLETFRVDLPGRAWNMHQNKKNIN